MSQLAIAACITDSAPAITLAAALPFYLIECHSRRTGPYWAERSQPETTRDQTITDIASGQYDDAAKVFALHPVSGRMWDVSAEFGREVLAQCLDVGDIPHGAMQFLERHLSTDAMITAWRLARVA